MRQLNHRLNNRLLVLLCMSGGSSLMAEVRLPALFSDHAVLQQDQAVPVWGWAAAAEKVTVSIGGQTQSTIAGENGKWQIKFGPMKIGQPIEMIVQGTNKIIIRDVLIGETWLCAGQSNMAMTVAKSKDYDQERAAAALPQIRMFTVANGRAEKALEDCAGSWVVCSPETVGEFSAVGFYFARDLHQRLGRAVGIIHTSRGGTLIESWLDLEAQQKCAELKPFFVQRDRLMAEFDHEKAATIYQAALTKWQQATEKAKVANQPLPAQPSQPYDSFLSAMNVGDLFNGKIVPLIPYALRGIVWYQGESNTSLERVPFYETQMRLLVNDWRKRWGEDLPIAWVQLPNFKRKMPWAELREAQLKCLNLPHTGMAITIDVGESRDLHPKNKQAVGQRLALWALGNVYGQQVPATSGPLLVGHEIRGNEIVLGFQHTNGGLVAKDGALKGFITAGENRAWKEAVARIEGSSVIVSSPKVGKPVAVRYAWASDPVCNLYNGAGLPASPFRTDDWSAAAP